MRKLMLQYGPWLLSVVVGLACLVGAICTMGWLRWLLVMIGCGWFGMSRTYARAAVNAENDAQPVRTIPATIIGKARASWRLGLPYAISFRLGEADSIELPVPAETWKALHRGDQGMLTFQGTRYLGFERK